MEKDFCDYCGYNRVDLLYSIKKYWCFRCRELYDLNSKQKVKPEKELINDKGKLEMNITIIVPSNNSERINKFIESYNKLKMFKAMSELVIIGNGELNVGQIKDLHDIYFLRYMDHFEIIPFARLRGIGMEENPNADFYLFLDDDHSFNEDSDRYLIECINFLISHKECGILQLEKKNALKSGFHIKRNAHVWTSRGLFIRNIGNKFDYEELSKLVGAGEDLLYGYEVLNQSYIPYERFNSPITRGCNLPNNYKELNDKSYSEELLDENIIGYIRKKYNQSDWKFYGNLHCLNYPGHLRNLIRSRLSNLI